jgi:Putative zinc-finger
MMTHGELENLATEYLEGILDPARRTAADDHLAACSQCQELLNDVRHAIETCRSAEQLTPPPGLFFKIRGATLGHARTAPLGRLRVFPMLRQPRYLYVMAMIIFSVSLIANAANFKLRSLNAQNLNPMTWLYRANRTGNMLIARAQKFFYDLRTVYEMESRYRNIQVQPGDSPKQPEDPSLTPAAPKGTIEIRGRQPVLVTAHLTGSMELKSRGGSSNEMR